MTLITRQIKLRWVKPLASLFSREDRHGVHSSHVQGPVGPPPVGQDNPPASVIKQLYSYAGVRVSAGL